MWHLLQGVNNTSKRKHSHEACLIWPQRLGLLLWKCMLMRKLFNKSPLFCCMKRVTIGAFSFWLSKWITCSVTMLYIPVGRGRETLSSLVFWYNSSDLQGSCSRSFWKPGFVFESVLCSPSPRNYVEMFINCYSYWKKNNNGSTWIIQRCFPIQEGDV